MVMECPNKSGRHGRERQNSLVSFLFAVHLLKSHGARRTQPFIKWGHVPPLPYPMELEPLYSGSECSSGQCMIASA